MQTPMNALKAVPAAIALSFPLAGMATEPLQTAQAGSAPAAAADSGTAASAASPSGATLAPVQVRGHADESYSRPNTSVATKTDTPILQTATKVEILTQQAIRDMGLQSQGLGQGLAALGIAGRGMGDLGDQFTFRGFATTTTLWNGFRVEDMGTNANGVNGGVWMNNVEQLELLRGASSILYGRAEPGGAINITTKKPLSQFGGSVGVGLGSYQNRWISADLGGPATSDGALLYRINLGHEQEDSWYTYGPTYRSTGIAPALEYRLSPQTKLYFEGQFRDMEGGPNQPYMPVLPGTNRIIDVDPADTLMPGAHSEYRQRRALLGVDHKFNDDWSLSWKYMHNKAENPLTVVSWVIGMYYPPDTASIEYTRGLTRNISGQRSNATMLELTGKLDTAAVKHTLLLGADYYNTSSYQNASFDCWCTNLSYADPPAYHYNASDFSFYPSTWTIKEKELGLYAQDQIGLPGDVHLLIGARYQRQTERVDSGSAYKKNQLLPRVAALWQPVPTVSVYYSYTENAGASQGLQPNGQALEPEHSKQHEVGAKFDLRDGLIGQLAIFELTKLNIASANPTDPNTNLGVGRVKSTGFEFSLQGELTRNWNVLSTYNFARPYVEEGASGANALQAQFITKGTLLPYLSKHSISLLTSYRLPLAGLEGWRVGGGYNWFSAPTRDGNSSVPTKSYGVASLFTSYQTKVAGYQTTFQLNVDNLFDKQYLLYQGDIGAALARSPDLGFGYEGGNYVGGNWGKPRTFKLGARVDF